MVIPRVLHQDRSAEPQILGSALLSSREPVTFSLPPERRHPERSASRLSHIGEFYGAKSKDPGDACWQMLFGAFRPQTTREIKKVTASERSASQIYSVTQRLWRGVRRARPERSRGNPEGAYLTNAARSFSTTKPES